MVIASSSEQQIAQLDVHAGDIVKKAGVARISPRDIAFIHPSQDALVKVTAYDYSIYGGLKGHVVTISSTRCTRRYASVSFGCVNQPGMALGRHSEERGQYMKLRTFTPNRAKPMAPGNAVFNSTTPGIVTPGITTPDIARSSMAAAVLLAALAMGAARWNSHPSGWNKNR